MKIKYNTILDLLFVLYVFSTIVISKSIMAKIIQIVFVIFIFLLVRIKNIKFTKYNFFDVMFMCFIFCQIIFGIAVLKDSAFNVGVTVFYNVIFSFAILNYFIYRKDMKKISRLYAITTVISLFILALLYYDSILSLRFTTNEVIKLFGVKLFGGHSSTALSMIALIPCFFLNLFYDEKHKKSNIIISIILFTFSILTGTRKTIIVFAFIFLFMMTLKGKNINFSRIIKILGVSIIAFSISFLMIFKISFLYDVIGYRVQNAIVYFNSDEKKTNDSSIIVRNRLIKKAMDLYEDKKMLGWGMNYFQASGQNESNLYTHNNFLEILTGGGIIGFFIYYIKYIIMFIAIVLAYIKNNNKYVWFCSLIFFSLMIFLEYWQVTYIYRYILIYQVFIVYLLYKNKNNRKQDSHEKEKTIS